jgi:uncharacterized protein (TIRG00374 family)
MRINVKINKRSIKYLRKGLPFAISIVLILILIEYAPWGKIGETLDNLHWQTIVMLVVLSFLYYGLKILRFWYLLKAIKLRRPFPIVALSYISAQPVSLLPAGEVYRSKALNRYAGVPIKDSISQFSLQGVLEGSAMALLMLVSSLAEGSLRVVAIIVALFMAAIIILIRRGYLFQIGKGLNHLPFLNITNQDLKNFSQSNSEVLTRRWLPKLFGISLITEIVGSAIAYVSVVGIGGHINIFQAALFYIIPVIVGFISFLPGGFGLSEQSAVGVLYLSHVSLAKAVAATLLMRVTIVLLGVLYGLAALLYGQFLLRSRRLKA